MNEDIVALIDRDLGQLRRARALLSTPHVGEPAPLQTIGETKPRKQGRRQLPSEAILEKQPETAPASAAGKRERAHKRRSKPAAEFSALRAKIPASAVAVSAAEVQKAEQARFSAKATMVPTPVVEGTLDALVRQLGAC